MGKEQPNQSSGGGEYSLVLVYLRESSRQVKFYLY